jgi:hypothetical protein
VPAQGHDVRIGVVGEDTALIPMSRKEIELVLKALRYINGIDLTLVEDQCKANLRNNLIAGISSIQAARYNLGLKREA